MADIIDFGALELATEETWYRRQRPERDRRAYLTFKLGDEEYGVELVRLREIIKARAPTEVPRAPAYIAGSVSVRGLVMPVVDMRVRLRIPRPPGTGLPTRCLVVARGDERYALLVDEVRHVISLGEDEIEAAPPMLARSEAEYIHGIGRAEGETEHLIILLDLDAVLRFDDLRARGAHGTHRGERS